jgi:RNA polymerase sigma-70 factor (ECF subfamily)
MSLDQDRLLVLLLDHRAMVAGYIAAIVREPNLAEDVFQNVALLVLKKGTRLSSEAEFPTWVRSVARLEALAALRKQRQSPKPLDESVMDMLEAPWSNDDHTTVPLAAEALRACLRRLSPHAQRLIALRFANNLRGKALAEKLGQPVNTIYVALSRIYRALSGCIRHRLGVEGMGDV